MQLPPEVDENFHADKMHALPFKATGTKVFDYRVKKDSIIYSGYGDTTVTFGIIFPRARVTGIKTTQLRVAGNDSLLCNILYNTHDIYLHSESHSLLGDIILPPENTSVTWEKSLPVLPIITGTSVVYAHTDYRILPFFLTRKLSRKMILIHLL